MTRGLRSAVPPPPSVRRDRTRHGQPVPVVGHMAHVAELRLAIVPASHSAIAWRDGRTPVARIKLCEALAEILQDRPDELSDAPKRKPRRHAEAHRYPCTL